MASCEIFLVIAFAMQMLLSSWPGSLVGGCVLLMFLGCAVWCRRFEGAIICLKRSLFFFFIVSLLWGSPFLFFFTDLLQCPEMLPFVPLGLCLVFGRLYVDVCRIGNKTHSMTKCDWIVAIVFGTFCFLLISPFAMYSFAMFADRWGWLSVNLLCIVYSVYMLVTISIVPSRRLLRYFLIDIVAVLFYGVAFSTSFLITLAFGFIVFFFGGAGGFGLRTIGMLSWHAALMILPVLSFCYNGEGIWREALSFRNNTINFLLLYELFAVLYAAATVLRNRRVTIENGK